MTDNKDILSFREFIAFADISRSKGYKALHKKELPYFKPQGGKVYLKKTDVENWMLQGRVPAASEIKAQSKIPA